MAEDLNGKRIAFLATDGVEQIELTEPREAVEGAGADTDLVSLGGRRDPGDPTPRPGRHLRGRPSRGGRVRRPTTTASCSLAASRTRDFLRGDDDAVAFVRDFVEAGKPVGAICHAPWTLVEADVVRGKTLTSCPTLQTDIRNAGGTWVDEEVHVDNGPRDEPQAGRPPGVHRQDRSRSSPRAAHEDLAAQTAAADEAESSAEFVASDAPSA